MALVVFARHPAGAASPRRVTPTTKRVTLTTKRVTPTTKPPVATTLSVADQQTKSQLDWVIGIADKNPDDAALGAHIAPAFLQAVPPEQWRALLVQLSGSRPLRLDAPVTLDARNRTLRFRGRTADGQSFVGTITTDASPPFLITGFGVRPADLDTGASPQQVGARLLGLAPQAAYAVAEVTSAGRCKVIDSDDGGMPVPVASAFKLFVLASLGRAVETGAVRWDEPLTLEDRDRSPNSPAFGDKAAGTVFSVAEAARVMMEVSDNTATDVLIRRLGRDRIEADLSRWGVTDPALDIPFLTTREMAQLKFGTFADRAAEFIGGDESTKRRIVAAIDAAPLGQFAKPTSPVHVIDLEWFATMEDLCRVHAAIAVMGGKATGAPILAAFADNTGIPLDPTVWRRVQFKGGSEPGLLSVSWLVERARDKRRFAVAVAVINDTEPFDTDPVVAEVAKLFPWLAARK